MAERQLRASESLAGKPKCRNPRRAAVTRALPERLTLAVMPGRAFRRLTSVPWLPGPIRTGPGKSVAIDNRATVTPVYQGCGTRQGKLRLHGCGWIVG